jgi:5-oxoprolinase (ATP-hydrolysing)
VQQKRDGHLLLERYQTLPESVAIGTDVDPVMLEIFNNLFMSIAEQMGSVLENTAYSVNIKERLDFSCAIFDPDGNLVANAPHMPVHLGSMSESIKTVIRENSGKMQRGDAFVLNAPYNGGTHLPDITIVKPVFGASEDIIFYVASRGHHADVGGITPGSMPADSTRVEQEGVLLDNLVIVKQGVFQEESIRSTLSQGAHPARNINTNMADFKAQLAACEKGMQELLKIIEHYGLDVVQAYMCHVQNNAEESVRRVLDVLSDGEFRYQMDDGNCIQVAVRVDKLARFATIDFSGTSAQHPGNFNAPSAIARAAVLYVFRCLVDGDIPLNEGCLKPLHIILPPRSMINPEYPAAVVAGNVETSQAIVDTLFGALGVSAAAQGTMNNVTWGNQRHQYYETLCGGEGASDGHHGCSAVHTHMTNSRLTDPEVLESRFPVLIEEFSIRKRSGGLGQFHGGDGIVRRTRFNETMRVSLLTGHRSVPPYGLAGGEAGMCGENRLERADGEAVVLSSSDSIEAKKGDVLVIKTPGGGGWGQTD